VEGGAPRQRGRTLEDGETIKEGRKEGNGEMPHSESL
jgi:hypothetical protein